MWARFETLMAGGGGGGEGGQHALEIPIAPLTPALSPRRHRADTAMSSWRGERGAFCSRRPKFSFLRPQFRSRVPKLLSHSALDFSPRSQHCAPCIDGRRATFDLRQPFFVKWQ